MDYKEDIRIQKTRRDLRNALIKLISEQPIEKITVKEICDTALVNRMTFYKYYEDKYQLLDDILFEIKNILFVEECKKAPKSIEELLDDIIRVFEEFIDMLVANEQMIKALKKNGNNKIFESIMSIMDSSFCEVFTAINKIKKLKYPIPLTASFFSGGLMASIDYGMKHPEEMSPQKAKLLFQNVKENILNYNFIFEEN